MTESGPNARGLRREWLAARIFAVVGGLLLVAVCVLVAISGSSTQVSPQDQAVARHQMALALCNAGLASALGFALVPPFTKLASDEVQMGAVTGRYTCYARTDASKYQITFDLMCKDLNDPKCINLFSVAQDGTGVIYQRR
jgi:hypothetical protein